MGKKERIKYIITALIYVLHGTSVFAQVNGDYRTVNAGNWNDLNNWQYYSVANWQAATTVPDQLAGQILIRHSMNVSMDQVMDQVIVEPTGQLQIAAGVTVTVTNSVSAIELNVKGRVINSGMLFFSPSANMFVDSGATYIHNSSISAAAVMDVTLLHTQSTWVYRGNGNLAPPVTFSNRTYGHLIFESTVGNWSRTVTGSGPFSCTSLTIEPNVMIINNLTGTHSINGDLIINGAWVNGSGRQKIVLSGNSGVIGGQDLLTFFDTLIIQNSSNYELLNDMTVSPNSGFIVEGQLHCHSNRINGNNNGASFYLNSGAWLETSNPGGITASIYAFSNTSFSNLANYAFSGGLNQDLSLYNANVRDIRIKGSDSSHVFLKTDHLNISGSLEMLKGLFHVDSNTIIFSGKAIQGQADNFRTNAFSSMRFEGDDSAIFIPTSVQELKELIINKNIFHVELKNDLLVNQNLSLLKGKLINDSYDLLVTGNLQGGSDSSFIQGSLMRNIPSDSLQNVFYPIGGQLYHPLFLNQANCSAETKLKVSVYENIPSGSPDGMSTQGMMSDRYYQIFAQGANSINSIHEIVLSPTSSNPSITLNSSLAYSNENTPFSYHGMGGDVNQNSISSTRSFSSCQLAELSSPDGLFFGIAEEGIAGGVYTDSICSSLFEIKVYIQGLYTGNGMMRACIDAALYPDLCDTIFVELHSDTFPFELLYAFQSTISTSGIIQLDKGSVIQGDYYIVIRHRNSVETWSYIPVNFSDSLNNFNFSNTASKAFGNNMLDSGDGTFSIFSGDIGNINDTWNKNGIIDLDDLLKLETDLSEFSVGYILTDLTGDQVTDLSDYSLMENNHSLGIQLIKP